MVTRRSLSNGRPWTGNAALKLVAACALLAASTGLLAATQAAAVGAKPDGAGRVIANCSWDHPGHNVYKGDVTTAVDTYTDLAPDVRERLKQRIAKRDYDEMVDIRRDEISGKQRYESDIRDMHFGNGTVCRTVTRTGWDAQAHERGMVYCEAGQCILVPTVCRNVSRVTRREAPRTVASIESIAPTPEPELMFEPPAAGTTAPVGDGGSFVGGTGPTGPSYGWLGVPPSVGGGGGSTAPVPEPETWLMMGVGLALLGFLKLRRRPGR